MLRNHTLAYVFLAIPTKATHKATKLPEPPSSFFVRAAEVVAARGQRKASHLDGPDTD